MPFCEVSDADRFIAAINTEFPAFFNDSSNTESMVRVALLRLVAFYISCYKSSTVSDPRIPYAVLAVLRKCRMERISEQYSKESYFDYLEEIAICDIGRTDDLRFYHQLKIMILKSFNATESLIAIDGSSVEYITNKDFENRDTSKISVLCTVLGSLFQRSFDS